MSHFAWTRLPALGVVLAVLCGCSQSYEIDLRKAGQFDDFKWNGVMRVRRVQTSFFDTPGIDRVELLSQDKRSVLIVTEGNTVRAYLELNVKPIEPPSTTQPATARAAEG